MSIQVQPKTSFTMHKPGSNLEDLLLVSQIKKLVVGTSPFVDTLTIYNNTKHCTVEVAFVNAVMQLIVTNPDDDTFNVNET